MAGAVQISGAPYLNAATSNDVLRYGDVSPEQAVQEQRIARRQQLANALLQQATGMPSGQMVGRFYVPPSWAQGLAHLAQGAAGYLAGRANDRDMQDMASARRQTIADALANYQHGISDVPAVAPSTLNSESPQQRVAQAMVPPPSPQDILAKQLGPGPDQQNFPSPGIPGGQPLPSTPSFGMLSNYPGNPTEPQGADVSPPGESNAPPGPQQQVAQALLQGPVSPGTPARMRTAEEKQAALAELLTHQDPLVRHYGTFLAQQQAAQQEKEAVRQQAILMQNLKAAHDLVLKNTQSADNAATLANQRALHERPSGNALTQAADQVVVRDPVTGELRVNEPAIAAKERIAGAGAAKTTVAVNTQLPASEEAQKKYMDSARVSYDQLKTAPQALDNIEKAKALIPQAQGFMGPGGEGLLQAAKFLNNRLGMSIDVQGIKSAEELRSRIFFNIMENLKKMDAQPSQMQQQIMMESLGKLGTDPNALSSVLDAYAETIRGKVDAYNTDVKGAEQRGVKFPYDPTIRLPAPRPSGPPRISSDAEYQALPRGSVYLAPDGSQRTKQ